MQFNIRKVHGQLNHMLMVEVAIDNHVADMGLMNTAEAARLARVLRDAADELDPCERDLESMAEAAACWVQAERDYSAKPSPDNEEDCASAHAELSGWVEWWEKYRTLGGK